ncbi:hypothetical protein NLX85_28940 [Micromonospora sp. A3M-1-15]|nr:hypothetical protein [Micromonospora sp. A3M-1-15]
MFNPGTAGWAGNGRRATPSHSPTAPSPSTTWKRPRAATSAAGSPPVVWAKLAPPSVEVYQPYGSASSTSAPGTA